jgi:4-hydroxy-3-methylbut-2-enyl diphosphate reductase
MKLLKSNKIGLCPGVKRALELALLTLKNKKSTILGKLAHNSFIQQKLSNAGAYIESDITKVKTKTVMTTTHGVSEKIINFAKNNGLELIDLTCPIVQRNRNILKKIIKDGLQPIIIGKKAHPEVQAVLSDFDSLIALENENEVWSVPTRKPVGVVIQTTASPTRTQSIIMSLYERFGIQKVRVYNTLCKETLLRQQLGQQLASQADVTIVIGSNESSNTCQLAHACAKKCARVFIVETPEALDLNWFRNVDKVALCSGTSTPDDLVDMIEAKILALSMCSQSVYA